MWIVELALRRPYTIAVLSLTILIMGILSTQSMRRDIFPTIDIPVVLVVWNYKGLSAEDMERRVVLISERAYSSTVNGISRIESDSISGIGTLKIYFEPGTDIGSAISQIVGVSQTAMRIMPPGITAPNVIQFNASNVTVAQLTVSSPTLSEQELFDYGLNFLRIRLFTVPGLAVPAPYGGKQRQVMVDVDPSAVAAHNLSPQDVLNALLASNLILPAGTTRIGHTEYDVLLNSSPNTIEEFKQIPVKTVDGATVFLGDIATVHDGFAVQHNIVRVNGQRSTYLAILKKADASTLAVVDAARELLPDLKQLMPAGTEITLDFDQSIFVRRAIAGVLHEALVSSLLVSIMILLFLGSWRSVVIVCTSIPLAICVALTGLYLTNNSLNIMTLGGLSLAIGMLVDDATVEVENIHRNRHLGKGITRAILDGASQVATPALAATLTICIVFSPVILLVGPARFLFTSLALSVVFSMLASYLLSRTLVPVLGRMLIASEALHPPPLEMRSLWDKFNIGRDLYFDKLQEAYGRLLAAALQHRKFVLGCLALLTINTAVLSTLVGMDFFPEVDAGQMRLQVRAPIGTRIEETEVYVARIEQVIRELIPPEELRSITDNIGIPTPYNLAFVQTDNTNGQDAEIRVALTEKHRPTAEYRQAIRKNLAQQFPEVVAYFQSADIISQVLNFGLSAPVDIEIEGSNIEKTIEIARDIRDKIQAIPGVYDVRIPQVTNYPALHVDVDRQRAAQLGLKQSDVANALITSLSSSTQVSPNYWLNPLNSVNYLVAVQTPIRSANSVDDLLGTPITGKLPYGNKVANPFVNAPGSATYLGSVASIRPAQTLGKITHDMVQRVIEVQCSVEKRDLGSTAGEIQSILDNLEDIPPNVKIRIRGQYENMKSSFQSLGLGLILASVLVYMLMVVLFQSWLDPFIIMVAVPGALIGVITMLAATGTTLNIESLMGTILAVGVAVSNSILVVSFANEVREAEGLDALSAALLAGKSRLRPVLMTALAMVLGMLPMAFAMSEGGEQNAPLGRAVIGGLLCATCVTLFIVPVVYSLLRVKMPSIGRLDARFELEAADGVTQSHP